MSKKNVQSCCIVIDASIARAAGPPASRHPTGAHCRDFLISVRGVCHRMAWSEAIKVEWEKHESNFALQWRLTMMNLRKLVPVQAEGKEDFRTSIDDHSTDANVVAIMRKDAHLIEAALVTDSRVASCDDAVRGHFAKLATAFQMIRHLIWVNPAIAEEEVIDWLENGARAEQSRRLRP